MTDGPQVSVVMAVRDAAAEALASAENVLGQRGVTLELVLVDDGSSDDTAVRLATLAARDERVRLVRQSAAGLTMALIRGCAEARGAWIARQDAGDFSHPERLARQAAVLARRPTVVLVSCWTLCVGPAGEPLYVERGGSEPGREFAIAPIDERTPGIGPTSHGSVLFRRDAYLAAGGYRREFALGQDWDLWYRLGERGACEIVGRPLYLRQLMPRSLSFAAHDLQRTFRSLAREAARLRAAGDGEAAAIAAAAKLSHRFDRERAERLDRAEALGNYHLGSLLRGLEDPRARAYFGASLLRRPTMLRAWLRWFQSWAPAGPARAPGDCDSAEAQDLLSALRVKAGGAA